MSWWHEIYYRVRNAASKPEERGLSSAGYLHGKIRDTVVALCSDDRGAFLEVGSGEGLLLSELAERNPYLDITGADISDEQLRAAQELFNKKKLTHVRCVKSMVGRLPFPEHSFDIVASVNTVICLGSLVEVRGLVSEMARVAKRNGTMVIECRNRNNLFLRLKYRLARYYDETVADHPFYMCTRRELEMLLDEYGFRVEKEIKVAVPFIPGTCSVIMRARRYD